MSEKKRLVEYAYGQIVDGQPLLDLGILDVMQEFDKASEAAKYKRVASLTVMAAFNSYSSTQEETLMMPDIDELFSLEPSWDECHELHVKFNPPRLRPRFAYAPAQLSTVFGLVSSTGNLYSIGNHSGPNAGFVDLSPEMSQAARSLVEESMRLGEPLLAPKLLGGLEGMSEPPQL